MIEKKWKDYDYRNCYVYQNILDKIRIIPNQTRSMKTTHLKYMHTNKNFFSSRKYFKRIESHWIMCWDKRIWQKNFSQRKEGTQYPYWITETVICDILFIQCFVSNSIT